MALAIVDASVILKWFLDEPDHVAARRVREDFLEGTLRIRAPSLLPFEVMNGLRYSRRYSARELLEAGQALDRIGLVTVPLFGEYLEKTVHVALACDCTMYDASYVALAALQQCALLTADEDLIDRARGEARLSHIRDYRLDAMRGTAADG